MVLALGPDCGLRTLTTTPLVRQIGGVDDPLGLTVRLYAHATRHGLDNA